MSHKEAKQERKEQRENPLNDQKFWSTEIRPPFFARAVFQARLDMRAGKNMEGKSVLVLRWAPEVFTELYDEKTPRYWVSRVKDGEKWLYTSVPRWIIERRLEKGQYADSWNKTRFIPDGAGGLIDKGPPPDDYHVFTWLCAEHEGFLANGQPACCERAWQDGRKRCWGTYRSPNDYDLQCVEAAVRRREGEDFVDPYAPLTQHDLEAVEAASGMQIERIAMEAEMRAQEILRDQRIFSDTNTLSFDLGQNKPLIITPN